MTLPNLLVIGAMKAGTTALHDQLAAHPDVYMSATKELDHFIREDALETLDQYRASFSDGAAAPVRGESSPNYSKRHAFPGVPERIEIALPDPRFVYLVRDPIERLRSHYQHHLHQRGRWMTFEAAVRYEGFLAPSRYATQIRPFVDIFGADRILVVTSELLRDQPAQALAAIHEFLGVRAHPPSPRLRSHVTAHKRMPRFGPRAQAAVGRLPSRLRHSRALTRSIDGAEHLLPATRDWLCEELRPEIEALRHLDVVGFDGWGLLD